MATQKDSLMDALKTPARGRTGSSLEMPTTKGLTKAGRPLEDIEQWPISALKPHPKNQTYFSPLEPKEFERLKNDIAAHGIHDALIVTPEEADGARVILAGHNRWRAAQELGMVTVPVRVVVLNDADQVKFIIRDNLLRRQLSPEEVRARIRVLYGEELQQDRRGGDRKSKEAREGKSKVHGAIFDPLHKKIAREIGITEGTAKRYLAAIRNPEGKTATKASVKASQTPEISTERGAKSQGRGNTAGAPERLLEARQALKKGSSTGDRRAIIEQIGNIFREVMQQATDAERARYAAEIVKELNAWRIKQ